MDKWTTAKTSGCPLAHSLYDGDRGAGFNVIVSVSLACALGSLGTIEPTHDEVGSFSVMTASAVYPLARSNSMKKWAQFA
jgi:hypothetical protein